MATDATGTPTAKGIPKYDTTNDAPSGLGFNAAMDAIDVVLDGYVPKPTGIATGEVPVWNGTTWVRSSVTRVGASSLGSGTPSSSTYLRGDGTWASLDGVPAGVLSPYAGSAAPSGWLLADGTAVSRTTYSALFTAISTTYGVGDGSTTFNLPDMRGRAPFGYYASSANGMNALANNEGAAVADRGASHHHLEDPAPSTGGYSGSGYGANYNAPLAKTTGYTNLQDNPAYLVVNFIVKT